MLRCDVDKYWNRTEHKGGKNMVEMQFEIRKSNKMLEMTINILNLFSIASEWMGKNREIFDWEWKQPCTFVPTP